MSRRQRLILMAYTLAVSFVLLTGAAAAELEGPERDHSAATHWYEGWCCNLMDCRPARPGELRWTPAGWLHVPSGVVVPEDQLRPIPDRAPERDKLMMHVCISEHDLFEDGRMTVPKGGPRCLYKGALGT